MALPLVSAQLRNWFFPNVFQIGTDAFHALASSALDLLLATRLLLRLPGMARARVRAGSLGGGAGTGAMRRRKGAWVANGLGAAGRQTACSPQAASKTEPTAQSTDRGKHAGNGNGD